MKYAPLIAFALCALIAAAPLGDRLVVSINNEGYTQRQVELYITVKETLRKTEGNKVRLLEPGDWLDALQVFTEDMVILQESQRLGSFPAGAEGSGAQLVQRYDQLVKDKIAKNASLRDVLLRLGADETAVARTLETVLRVAMFRRTKDKQAQLTDGGARGRDAAAVDTANLEADAGPKRNVSRWLVELEERAVVRRYDGAEQYELIQPTLGKSIDGR